jgi:hypothetical protein
LSGRFRYRRTTARAPWDARLRSPAGDTTFDEATFRRATETVRFGLDGRDFEIDLSKSHAKQLRGSLEWYVQKGRKTGGRRGSRRNSRAADKSGLRSMRAWAKARGMKVSERGRVSAEVQEAYRKAH